MGLTIKYAVPRLHVNGLGLFYLVQNVHFELFYR